MVSKEDLLTVQGDNYRNNPPGVSDEVMEDLGFTPWLDFPDVGNVPKGKRPQDLSDALARRNRGDARALQAEIICGDCLEVIPCQHADGRGTFGH